MNAPARTVLAVGLLGLAAAACDAVLSIRTLDATGLAEGGGQATGADATVTGDSAPEASAEATAPFDAPAEALLSDAALSDAGITDAAVTFVSSTCAACADASCGGPLGACAADPVFCAPYENCLAHCPGGDPACRSQCTIDHPLPVSGVPALSALSACLAASCATDCNLPYGAFAGYLSEPDAAAACQQCLNINAAGDSLACATSVDCDAYWRCYASCPTPDCKLNCALEHEAGVALFRPLQSDYSGICSGPCGYGKYWACVGNISWPSEKSMNFLLTVPVIDFFYHDETFAGETVSVCAFCPCTPGIDMPFATQTTDDSGTVVLPIDDPNVNSSDQGLNGCVQIVSPTGETVPYYGFWGYPLSEPVVNPATGPGSPAANLAAQSAQLFTPAELEEAAQVLNVTLVQGRGQIGASVFDCFDNPASGVRVTINSSDPQIGVYYANDDAGATSTAGLAFLFNVQPGQYQLTALPDALDGASSIVNVYVGDGGTTAAGMFPTPLGPIILPP